MRHPLHPALVHFPIACWTLAVVADLVGLWLGDLAWRWSAGLLAIGCSMAVLAMLAGMVELHRVPEGVAMRDAYWHMGLMLAAFSLFTARLLAGVGQMRPAPPDALCFVLDAGGFACLAVGGWLGGRLVYGHGVGRQ